MPVHVYQWACIWLFILFINPAYAVTLTDDRGREVTLAHSPTRIISLAPHVTELLYAIGDGDRMVGADEYSDFPEAALHLPRIGNSSRIDIERVLSLKPDLVVGWSSGNAEADIARLEDFGVPVYITEISSLENIAHQLTRLGRLTGSSITANDTAGRFRQRLEELRRKYAGKVRVSVFYQVWDRPLMTVNGRHFISDAIQLCGGVSLFPDMEPLAPTISKEAVVAANPQAIITGRSGEDNSTMESMWGRWKTMDAVRYGNLFIIPSDLIARPTPRILYGVAMICDELEQARINMHKE